MFLKILFLSSISRENTQLDLKTEKSEFMQKFQTGKPSPKTRSFNEGLKQQQQQMLATITPSLVTSVTSNPPLSSSSANNLHGSMVPKNILKKSSSHNLRPKTATFQDFDHSPRVTDGNNEDELGSYRAISNLDPDYQQYKLLIFLLQDFKIESKINDLF